MKKSVLLLLILVSWTCFAKGNIAEGAKKSLTCAACHGEKGVSSNPIWPNLAGQHAAYLLKQLQDYKEGGNREVAAMTVIVSTLSLQDMQDLAVYYASLPKAEGTTPKAYLQRGERLYRGGDFKAGISACIACHGPRGIGNAQANFPMLSGQHAPYTIEQLQSFKQKKRRNDLNSIMHDVSKRMSQNDMEAVSYYIQGLY